MLRRSLPSLLALVLARKAAADIPDGRFAEDTVVPSINQPTGLGRAPHGSNRMFIITKGGAIRLVKDGSLLAQPFAALSPIYTGSECGLIGITFDPDFATNHYVYVFITVSGNEQRILRLTDVNDVGMNVTPVMTGLPTNGANHDGGGVGFGPDGRLYWSIGDLGSFVGIDADLSTLAAKVGRANIDGTVPADNPFVDGAGGNNDYIWARGFRNPFTMTFEPRTGRLFLNVVGSQYEQIFVVGRGDHGGWNDYENNQPQGYIAPVIVYRTNNTYSRNLGANGAVRQGGVLTLSTTANHGFRRGQKLTLAGIGDASMNGDVFVASVPGPAELTALQAGPDATSGGGSATSQNYGGSLTGGTFYEATAFAPEFHGNFIFGDYNSGDLVRAVLDPTGQVASVDRFGTNFGAPVDVEVGPDGALWVADIAGRVVRVRDVSAGQRIVATPRRPWLVEGGAGALSVQLKEAPAAAVTVSVAVQGDGDVQAMSASLTFSPADWDAPQPLLLLAAADGDARADSATVTLSAPGLPSESIFVRVRDVSSQAILLSTGRLVVEEGEAGGFTVALDQPPAADVTVTVTSTSPAVLLTAGASLTFTPGDYAVPQAVAFSTFEDADGDDAFARLVVEAPGADPREVTVRIADDERQAPRFTSTPPSQGAVGVRLDYAAVASGQPSPTYRLVTGPAGVVFDGVSGALAFTPRVVGPIQFVIEADNGVPPAAVQDFTVQVAANAPPTVSISEPSSGAVVRGQVTVVASAGDDGAVVRAELFADDVSLSVIDGAATRFEFSGDKGWLTTGVNEGPHELRVTVRDDTGQEASARVMVTVQNQATSNDAGVGALDAGGVLGPSPADGGCACSAQEGRGLAGPSVLAALGFLARRRRRRAPSSR